jgi:hypothetical protein
MAKTSQASRITSVLSGRDHHLPRKCGQQSRTDLLQPAPGKDPITGDDPGD